MFLNLNLILPNLSSFVSVPCRGAMFLNSAAGSALSDAKSCFRPLSGSYVSQWEQSILYVRSSDAGFRPLSGSYVSQCFLTVFTVIFCLTVSVPCRGAMFLNIIASTYVCVMFGFSFRPLSGSYVSQFFFFRNCIRHRLLIVSVPCRGAMFLNYLKETGTAQKRSIVSVPCRGAMFLNMLCQARYEAAKFSFRPLSGSYVSQYSKCIFLPDFLTCFRPLSGSYVSQ